MQLHPWVSLQLPDSSGWVVCRKHAAAEAEEPLLSADVLHWGLCRAQGELSVLWGVGLEMLMGSETQQTAGCQWLVKWKALSFPSNNNKKELSPHYYYFYNNYPGGFHTTMGWIPSGFPSIMSSFCWMWTSSNARQSVPKPPPVCLRMFLWIRARCFQLAEIKLAKETPRKLRPQILLLFTAVSPLHTRPRVCT